ncbi:MAG: zinc-binding dehydrogenase [Pseudomonadales bacterium]
MPTQSQQLLSRINADNTLEIWLEEITVPDPGPDEVLVKVEATPINPSDLGLLFGPADMTTARAGGSADSPSLIADVPAEMMRMVTARVGEAMPVGNEASGTVVAAGSSDMAQALQGKLVGIIGGAMYTQYRVVNVFQCLELSEGTTSAEGASCFVNPLTSLAMVETMRMENHKALVHTAAASNLGQMLNKICIADGVDLVNIVRKPEQEALLKELGAKYVVNSSADSYYDDLTDALFETGATLAFDATGGGKLGSSILTCMEAAALKSMTGYNGYGSDVYKQLYIYGGLDRSATVLTRNFGFSWGVAGFLLTPFLQKVGMEKGLEMRARVASEIKTTFASNYTQEVSLADVLTLESASVYGKQATGEKFLIRPQA